MQSAELFMDKVVNSLNDELTGMLIQKAASILDADETMQKYMETGRIYLYFTEEEAYIEERFKTMRLLLPYCKKVKDKAYSNLRDYLAKFRWHYEIKTNMVTPNVESVDKLQKQESPNTEFINKE